MGDAPAADSVEAEFARRLAGNEKKGRDRALKKLKQFITLRAARTDGGFTRPEMLSIWKGLFYCMWMSDKPLVQEQLANTISEIMIGLPNAKTAMLFFDVFLETMQREWRGIDRLRMDKFYLLVRNMLEKGFRFLKSQEWDSGVIDWMLAILKNGPISPTNPVMGMHYHMSDIYLEELAKIGKDDLSQEVVLRFLDPYCIFVTKARNADLVRSATDEIFQQLIENSRPALDLIAEEEDGLVDIRSHTQLQEIDSSPINALNVDYNKLADRLYKLATEDCTLSRNRKKAFRLVEKFRELADGRLPLVDVPDAEYSSEDEVQNLEESLTSKIVSESAKEVRDKRENKKARRKMRKKDVIVKDVDADDELCDEDSHPTSEDTTDLETGFDEQIEEIDNGKEQEEPPRKKKKKKKAAGEPTAIKSAEEKGSNTSSGHESDEIEQKSTELSVENLEEIAETPNKKKKRKRKKKKAPKTDSDTSESTVPEVDMPEDINSRKDRNTSSGNKIGDIEQKSTKLSAKNSEEIAETPCKKKKNMPKTNSDTLESTVPEIEMPATIKSKKDKSNNNTSTGHEADDMEQKSTKLTIKNSEEIAETPRKKKKRKKKNKMTDSEASENVSETDITATEYETDENQSKLAKSVIKTFEESKDGNQNNDIGSTAQKSDDRPKKKKKKRKSESIILGSALQESVIISTTDQEINSTIMELTAQTKKITEDRKKKTAKKHKKEKISNLKSENMPDILQDVAERENPKESKVDVIKNTDSKMSFTLLKQWLATGTKSDKSRTDSEDTETAEESASTEEVAPVLKKEKKKKRKSAPADIAQLSTGAKDTVEAGDTKQVAVTPKVKKGKKKRQSAPGDTALASEAKSELLEEKCGEPEINVQTTKRKKAKKRKSAPGNIVPVSEPSSVEVPFEKFATICKAKPENASTSTFVKFAAAKVNKSLQNKHLAATKRKADESVTAHSPKRVFFQMSKTQIQSFRKTDKAIAVSPSPSNIAFDPRKTPDFGLLKRSKTPQKTRKSASDFF